MVLHEFSQSTILTTSLSFYYFSLFHLPVSTYILGGSRRLPFILTNSSMKNLIALASFVGAACALPTTSWSGNKATSSSHITRRAANASSFPSTSGTNFVIDGKQQYFAGTNTYWIGFRTNNADVDLVMKNIASSGMKVLRVWGFNDVTSDPGADGVYYQSFINGEAKINTGANGLERLDYVVKSAEENGVKLIINFVNNWTDYGGMASYFEYAGITSNAEWYVSEKAQTQYKAYIKAVVSRYSTSPAIFAWELANEPRCNGCDLDVLTNWVSDSAAYVKSLDSEHMVTTGEEGFGLDGDGSYPYQFGEGGDFNATCADPNIDFCVYHLYPESWGTDGEQWGNEWIENHAKVCEALGKPCVLEEFGFSNTCSVELAWETTALKTKGNGGDMFWQYGDTLSNGQTHQDGNTVYYQDDLWKCMIEPHIEAIKSQ
jgi:mannan endo-1,4-beta-mannosidase